MYGKFVLCFAFVLVGQAMSASVFDGEELKKVGEQFGQSAIAVTNHLNQLLGLSNSADPQKTYDKVKGYVTKGISDLETEAGKLKEIVRKNTDPKLVEKIDELEKEVKKHAADAKTFFDDKIGKPINDKYKDDVKKISEAVLKSTKDVETTINKAIDSVKKP